MNYPHVPALGKTETSAAAAPSAKAARGIHAEILRKIQHNGPMTADEFADLFKQERLAYTGERRRNSFGNLMRVYAIAKEAA